MGLTVRDALSLNVLKGARVVAGHRGLDNPIRWTHILDLPQVAQWVKGGEVLITSGLGIHDDAEAQVKYIREAAEKKVAAVFVTVREYLPQTTPLMREIADQHALPLVEIPRTTAFVEVTEAILRRLASSSPDLERDYLLDALLAGNLPASDETFSRLRDIGIDLEQRHAVVLAQCAGPAIDQQLSEEDSRSIMGALNGAPRRGLIIIKPNWVIALFALGARDESSVPFAGTLETSLRESAAQNLRVGVGRLVRRIADFPVAYGEAQKSLFINSIIDRPQSVLHYNELGMWRLLLRLQEGDELERFAGYHLSAVAEHDRGQQTTWLKTLETFLEHNGNLRATARALDLHRNTVTYQMEHISKLIGRDLNDPEIRLNIQIALRINRLLSARGFQRT